MKKINTNKEGEFSFVWLFAIIAGVAILVLAVYGVSRIADTSRYQIDTEVAKKISIITDPLQAGFAEGSFGKIIFKSETRINNYCSSEEFGKNDISVSTRSRIGEEWTLAGGEISVHNKYIFSEQEEGKEYYVFSKPFYFPYRVADLIFLTNKKYCFIDTPDSILDEILGLNLPNIAIENCSESDIQVCFDSLCEISVYGACIDNCESLYDEGSVIKNGEKIEYTGSLMYAAIFSDKDNYDCNVQRLMYRTSKISEVFVEKANLMNSRGCNTNLQPDLIFFKGMLMNADSDSLISINDFAKQIEIKNQRELCGLW